MKEVDTVLSTFKEGMEKEALEKGEGNAPHSSPSPLQGTFVLLKGFVCFKGFLIITQILASNSPLRADTWLASILLPANFICRIPEHFSLRSWDSHKSPLCMVQKGKPSQFQNRTCKTGAWNFPFFFHHPYLLCLGTLKGKQIWKPVQELPLVYRSMQQIRLLVHRILYCLFNGTFKTNNV